MKSKKTGPEKDVEKVKEYMLALEHPLKNEIEAVRKIISGSSNKISERIKWNAPSYYYKEDLVTFNPRAKQYVHLVFHHPAIITITSTLLEGDYKDRRMVYLHSMNQVTRDKEELQRIMQELVAIMDTISIKN